jgi:hypothetical protein
MYEVKNNSLFETTSLCRYSVHNIPVNRTIFDSTFDIEPQQPEYGQISLQKRMVSILYQPEFDNTDHRVPSLTCRARRVKCELAPSSASLSDFFQVTKHAPFVRLVAKKIGLVIGRHRTQGLKITNRMRQILVVRVTGPASTKIRMLMGLIELMTRGARPAGVFRRAPMRREQVAIGPERPRTAHHD